MIGLILLDEYGRYLVNGELPKRPENDKELLTKFLTDAIVSDEAAEILPKSILNKAYVAPQPSAGVKIRELAECDILLVHRTVDNTDWTNKCRLFRLGNFKKLTGVEVWMRRNS